MNKSKNMDTNKEIEKLADDFVEAGEQETTSKGKTKDGVKDMVRESLEDVAKVMDLTEEAADTLKTLQEEKTVTPDTLGIDALADFNDNGDTITVGEEDSKPKETSYSVQVGPKDPLVLEIEAKEAAEAAKADLEPAPKVDAEEVLNTAFGSLKGGLLTEVQSDSIQVGDIVNIKIGETIFHEAFVIKNELKANELTGKFDCVIVIKFNGRIKEFNIKQTVEILK